MWSLSSQKQPIKLFAKKRKKPPQTKRGTDIVFMDPLSRAGLLGQQPNLPTPLQFSHRAWGDMPLRQLTLDSLALVSWDKVSRVGSPDGRTLARR